MTVLIAGIPSQTYHYEAALRKLKTPFLTSLSLKAASSCRCLLLPGGGDIDPSLFHQKNQGSQNIDPELDRAQLALLHFFVQQQRPVLGICKGMQLLNLYFGGSLIQHLPSCALHQWNKKDQLHTAFNEPGSILFRLYGSSCLINSAHHQGIGQPGSGFSISQRTSDGVAEAIEHQKMPVLGVQWHPERAGFSFSRPETADGKLLIQYFLTKM